MSQAIPVRHLAAIASLLLAWACLPGPRLPAAWGDSLFGQPAVRQFRLTEMGAQSAALALAQDRDGNILVGAEALFVFDGLTWTSVPMGDDLAGITALSVLPDGRVLAGSMNELGYFEKLPTRGYRYHSLTASVPPQYAGFDRVWGCASVNGDLYYFCRDRVLRWNGTKFDAWDFPTAYRLAQFNVGEEVWFTHVETGLYQITRSGPTKVHDSSAFGPRGPLWAERDEHGLVLASNAGIFRAGQADQPLCSPQVVSFLDQNLLTSVVRLPSGEALLSTLKGGIGIMSATGRLSRTLDQAAGLPGNNIQGLLLDREGTVWVAGRSDGVFRFNSAGAYSLIPPAQGSLKVAIQDIAALDQQLLLATSRGVQSVETSASGQTTLKPIGEHREPYYSVSAGHGRLLASRYETLIEFQNSTEHPLLFSRSVTLSNLTASSVHPNRLYAIDRGVLVYLQVQADGTCLLSQFSSGKVAASDLFEDTAGRLWIATPNEGIKRLSPDAQPSEVRSPETSGDFANVAVLCGSGDNVAFLLGPKAYLTRADARSPTFLTSLPGLYAITASLSADARRLYVFYMRARPDGTPEPALGRINLTEHGRFATWTELALEREITSNTPYALHLRTEDGSDTLWVGGSEGLIRLKPQELRPASTPIPPRLHLTSAGASASETNASSFPFFGHRLIIQAQSPEVGRRPQLWFQSRMAGDNADWSRPTASGTFEFANLSDGDYHLEVRTLDSAGRASDPAYYTFQILPPWYRTGWAYSGYILAGVLASFGYIRVRERRIRLRNQELERVVAERTAELIKANAAKDEFLAGVSHEIRNPMNGVIGLAATIDGKSLDPADRKRLDQLRYCATHLSGLLEDILDFSRLQAGAVTLSPQTFDLPDLIHSLGAITAVESAHAGIPVELAVSPAVPRFLVGDPARIRQILLNFIINALKYSGRGTVCVTVWSKQTRPEDCEVIFAVSDDGPGISTEEQQKLFNRFERGAAARERRVGGTGLGLSVSKSLAEKMGGRLWLESELGIGSTFYFAVTLPVDYAARPVETAKGRPAPPSAAFRALVVDDEEYNRIALAALLEDLGFASDFASDGVEAVEAASRQRYDAIFLDVDLPRKSGLDVARELRARPGFPPDLPIVATTAFSTPEKRAQCIASGMTGFLGKPVSAEKIRSALAAATAAQRASAPILPPGELSRPDPLGALRLLANRKAIPLEREIAVYLDELTAEARALDSHLALRDPAAASRSAHRLTGRFAFIRASAEEQLAREIEAAVVNELWDAAEAAWHRLSAQLPELRARLTSTN